LEKIGVKQVPLTGTESNIGLTKTEARQFSFLKIMNALANPQDRRAQEAAKFERECSEAASEKQGKAARGFMVPVDVLNASQRDLTVGTSTAGGDVVATNLLSGSFIDLLRHKSAILPYATMLQGLQGNIAIPRNSSAGTAYWIAEGSAPTESAQAFDQLTMSPKTLGAFTDISRKLLIQSSIDVNNFVRQDLAKIIALAIDAACMYGLGSSNQPQGIKPAIAAF